MCFGFFFLYAVVLGGIQAFAPEAARQLHDVPVRWAAMCLTFYMVASAGGMVIGGFLAADPSRCEKIVGIGFGIAAVLALTIGFAPLAPMAVPVLFALMGVASGMAGPSRDLIVKRAAPEGATGRVYGVVYSGLDIGQAFAPLVFGPLMDLHRPADVWLGIAIAQALLITTAFNVHRARRTALRAGGRLSEERARQTALRCRSMQVASTSSAGPLPPVLAREDLDLAVAGEARRLHPGADARDLDHAVAHHAAVVEQVARRHQPVADVEGEQPRAAGARDLRLELGIPPDVIDVDGDAERGEPPTPTAGRRRGADRSRRTGRAPARSC